MTSLFFPVAQRQKVSVCSTQKHSTGYPSNRQQQDAADEHIRELGRQAERAIAIGDTAAARTFTTAMYGCIAARTPAHRQRLENEAWARVTRKEWFAVLDEVGEHPGCFFDAAGAAIRRRMGRPA